MPLLRRRVAENPYNTTISQLSSLTAGRYLPNTVINSRILGRKCVTSTLSYISPVVANVVPLRTSQHDPWNDVFSSRISPPFSQTASLLSAAYTGLPMLHRPVQEATASTCSAHRRSTTAFPALSLSHCRFAQYQCGITDIN